MIEAVAKFIHQHALLKAGDRLGVAVSGGADSVALLRVMLELRGELGIVPAVAHFNHKIRGPESDGDEQFARELAEKFGLRFLRGEADVPQFARQHGLGLEAAARKLRYEYFSTLFQKREDSGPILDKIATAHTQNDQAETVLMRLLRGAGTRGLSGIRTSLDADVSETVRQADLEGSKYRTEPAAPLIIRPLLAVTRHEITAYLRRMEQTWREDSSNRKLEHTRNRVRHELIPLLERDFNPGAIKVLAEHAQMAQAEEEFWNLQVGQALRELDAQQSGILQAAPLLQMPVALQRRVIRAAAEGQGLTLDFEHIEAVRHLIHGRAGHKPKRLTLPEGVAEHAERGGDWELVLQKGSLIKEGQKDYEYCLPVPGSVPIPEIGRSIRTRLVTVQEVGKTAFQGYNQPQLLNPQCLGGGLIV